MTTKFDHLFAAAVPRIADGTHQRDELPREGGRWPISVVLRPSPDSTTLTPGTVMACAERLDEAADAFSDRPSPGSLHPPTRPPPPHVPDPRAGVRAL